MTTCDVRLFCCCAPHASSRHRVGTGSRWEAYAVALLDASGPTTMLHRKMVSDFGKRPSKGAQSTSTPKCRKFGSLFPLRFEKVNPRKYPRETPPMCQWIWANACGSCRDHLPPSSPVPHSCKKPGPRRLNTPTNAPISATFGRICVRYPHRRGSDASKQRLRDEEGCDDSQCQQRPSRCATRTRRSWYRRSQAGSPSKY